jgi:porin
MNVSRFLVSTLAVAAITPLAHAGAPAVSATYTGESLHVVDGGADRGSAYLGNVDVDMEFTWGEGDSMRAYVYLLGSHGDDPGVLTGDAQGVSNIAAPRAARMYEAWVEGEVFGVNLRAGLYDLNSEFDSIETAGLFAHPSFGIGPDFSQAGEMGPSIFPVTGFAIRARKGFEDNYLQIAVLDGVPGNPKDDRDMDFRVSRHDGALLVSEVGRVSETRKGHPFKVAAGTWHFTDRYENIEGDLERGNQGFYVLGERELVKWNRFSLSGFARVGIADGSINPFDQYVGGGLVMSGFLESRPDDRMGIALAHARFSEAWRDSTGADSAETAVEWSYEFPVAEWLTVQPKMQYIANPGGDPALDDAVVAGIRFAISYAP